MLSSVVLVLVDCVVLICRFENGRGVFSFVVIVRRFVSVVLWVCIVYGCGVCR